MARPCLSNGSILKSAALGLFGLAQFVAAATLAQQSAFPEDQRTKVLTMLADMRFQITQHYYDETFRGVDINARYDEYKQKIQSARRLSEGLRLVAGFVAGLKDSGTFFEPPPLGDRADYGYKMQIIGDRCFITQLRPGSDAAAKLKIGEEVLLLDRYSINRGDLWDIWYTLNSLEPATFTEFELRSLDGQVRKVTVDSTQTHLPRFTNPRAQDFFNNGSLDMEELTHELRQRHTEIGDVMVWKMPAFATPREDDISGLLEQARKHSALIVDLRGNPGGSIELLEKVLGSFVPANTEIAGRRGRKDMQPVVAKKWASSFEGKLFVLVDSSSAAATELFARTIQLQHRGLVIGDRTAGRVSEAHTYRLQLGTLTTSTYGISITEAELILPDGQSLENRGVIPDEILLPTAEDLAQGRDIVLARALEEAGQKIDPKAAGALFPFEWRPLSLSH